MVIHYFGMVTMKIIKFFLIIFFAVLNNQLDAQEKQIEIPYHSMYLELDNFQNDLLAESQQQNSETDDPNADLKKSAGKAFFFSLLLPGSGEFYVGKKGRGALFLGIEIAAWTGLLLNDAYADNLRQESYTYAVQHAGISSEGKDRDYWVNIGNYKDIYAYNEQRRRERLFNELYKENQDNYWNWDSKSNRYNYDSQRIDANTIEEQNVFFWGAIALNHLVSSVHAMIIAKNHNQQIDESMSWNLNFSSYKIAANDQFIGFRFKTSF